MHPLAVTAIVIAAGHYLAGCLVSIIGVGPDETNANRASALYLGSVIFILAAILINMIHPGG